MDEAVFADIAGFNGPNISFWRDMHYPTDHPFGGQSVDPSFVLTSVSEPSSIITAGLGLVAMIGVAYCRRNTIAI